MVKKIFSRIGKFLNLFLRNKRESEIEKPKYASPSPEVSKVTEPPVVESASPAEKPLRPVKEKAPVPPVTRKKKPRFDKKGIRVLAKDDDLGKLFRIDERENRQAKQEESFARMFEKSQTDSYQQLLLKEKKHVSTQEVQLTTGERLREYPPPQAKLDLHGFTAAEAQKKAEVFLTNSRVQGLKTVRVIVGKGLHSAGKAVLPDVIEALVIALKRQQKVLAFEWEKKEKRKSGAMIVYLIPGIK